MTRKLPPLADRLRAHRREFKLALRLHITPHQARLLIEQSKARKRSQQANDRLTRLLTEPVRRRATTPTPQPAPGTFENWDAPHMMRE